MADGNGHDPDSQIFDILIVGAGLSGLQAALSVSRANPRISYVILEARHRIGGKTLSQHRCDGRGKQELGAAWINDTNQSRMWQLAQDLGLSSGTIVQNTTGAVVVQDFGGDLVTFPYGGTPDYGSKADSKDCVRVRDLVESASQDATIFAKGPRRTKLDSISVEQYVWEQKASPRARATAAIWTHAMLGVDPCEVSLLFFLEYCRAAGGLMTMRSDCKDGGQYLRLHKGTSAFAAGMAEQLKPDSIRLSSPVIRIDQNQDSVVSVTIAGPSQEVIQAKMVIVTVPTPVYKTITFSPSLPTSKTGVADRTRYGCYTKYIVAFTKPFWREKGFCGLAQSFIGPVSVTRDTSDDEADNYALTCFIGGTPGRKWSALSDEEKQTSVLEQIGDMFADGEDISELVLEVMESNWLREEWSGWGCPCPVMPPGVLDCGFDALCAPFGNVHFVGTETATVWRGYMEGAVRSGERGAAEVLEALQTQASGSGRL